MTGERRKLMPIWEPKQLAGQIRKGELQNLYYIYGADLVQVRQLTAALIKRRPAAHRTWR